MVECKSAQQAVAREEPVVRECESRQRAAAILNKTFEMACKFINGQYIFHQPCGLWNAPCVHGCGYIHLSSSTPGSRKKCCANGRLSSASDNFDKELMMDHDLDKLPKFLRQVITSSPDFLKKSSHIQQFSCHGSYPGVQLLSDSGILTVWSRSAIRVHEWLCPSLYENCIKYLAKLRYILFYI